MLHYYNVYIKLTVLSSVIVNYIYLLSVSGFHKIEITLKCPLKSKHIAVIVEVLAETKCNISNFNYKACPANMKWKPLTVWGCRFCISCWAISYWSCSASSLIQTHRVHVCVCLNRKDLEGRNDSNIVVRFSPVPACVCVLFSSKRLGTCGHFERHE